MERHPLYFADLPLDEALPFVGKIKNAFKRVVGAKASEVRQNGQVHQILVEEEKQ